MHTKKEFLSTIVVILLGINWVSGGDKFYYDKDSAGEQFPFLTHPFASGDHDKREKSIECRDIEADSGWKFSSTNRYCYHSQGRRPCHPGGL